MPCKRTLAEINEATRQRKQAAFEDAESHGQQKFPEAPSCGLFHVDFAAIFPEPMSLVYPIMPIMTVAPVAEVSPVAPVAPVMPEPQAEVIRWAFSNNARTREIAESLSLAPRGSELYDATLAELADAMREATGLPAYRAVIDPPKRKPRVE